MRAAILILFLLASLPAMAVELRPPMAEASVPLPAPPMPSDPPQPTVSLPKAKTTESVQVVAKTDKRHGLLVKTLLVPVDGIKHGAHVVGHHVSQLIIKTGNAVAPYQNFLNALGSMGSVVTSIGILSAGRL